MRRITLPQAIRIIIPDAGKPIHCHAKDLGAAFDQ
jgi:ABC-type amino acid transport system permease subunit